MERISERTSGLDELGGFVKLGMKREALKLARRTLKQADITAKAFNDALDAILTLGDKCKSWMPVVEAAYAHLPKSDKQAVRHSMLYFYNSSRNHEAAGKFIPRRFVGEVNLMELALTCKTWLELKRMDEMDKLAKILSRTIKETEHPFMRTQLSECLAEYYTRKGLWNKAVELWGFVQLDNIFCRNAVEGIVDIHVAGALLAIKRGFELVKKFNQSFDPKMETTLPGNDKVIQQQAEKKFRKLQKILEKIVPNERQRELGFAL
jgi:hypothetical protein